MTYLNIDTATAIEMSLAEALEGACDAVIAATASEGSLPAYATALRPGGGGGDPALSDLDEPAAVAGDVACGVPQTSPNAIAFATVGAGRLAGERSGNLYVADVLYPAARSPDAADLELLEGRGPEPQDREVRAVLEHFQEHWRNGTGPVHTVYGLCTSSLEHSTGVTRDRQKQRGGGVRELVARLAPVLPRAVAVSIPERKDSQSAALSSIARAYVRLCRERGFGPPVTPTGRRAWAAVHSESGLPLASVMRKSHIRQLIIEDTRDLPPGPVVDVGSPLAAPEVVARFEWLGAAIARRIKERTPFPERPGRRGYVDAAEFARQEDGDGVAGDPLDWHAPHVAALAVGAAKCGLRRAGTPVASRRTWGALRDFSTERHWAEKGHMKSAKAMLANLMGAMGAVMEMRGRTLEDDPLLDLGPQLEGWLATAGRSPNFRSLVRQLADRLRAMAGLDHSWRSFGQACSDLTAVSGLSEEEVASRIGVARTTFGLWRAGKVTPSGAMAGAVELLEDLYEVDRGRLLVLMRRVRRLPMADDAQTPEQAKLLARAARFMDPADEGAPLAERLAKAERILATRLRQPSLFGARSLAAKRRQPLPVPGPEAPYWGECEGIRAYRCAPVSLVGDRGGKARWSAATADLNLKRWQASMAMMHRPVSAGGLGVATANLSIILYANPYGYVDQKVAWERELAEAGAGTRADRVIFTTSTVQGLISNAALFKPGTGWIARNPQLVDRMVALATPLRHIASDPRFEMAGADERARVAMPQSIVDRFREDWLGACGEVERIYRQLASDVAQMVETGRDPFEPIGVLAALDVPMAGFYRLMYESEGRWPDAETTPHQHHLAVRMSVLVRLASLLFLRSKNIRKMTYLPDQTGQLRYVDGFWEVVIPWREFKNSRNNDLFGPYGSRQDYRRRLPDQNRLYDLLRYYTSISLPALRSRFAGSPYLFPTRVSPFPCHQSMTKLFHRWTQEHCVHDAGRGTGMPGLMLFGLHALRDLGATTLLKDTSNPNRLQEAADLLQTSVEQVRYRYAKLGIVERLARADPLLSTASDLALGGTPLWADAS